MKIAQIAPLAESVPPKRYGGTERVVWALTEELVARGHEVTLFASGDSQTSAKLESVVPRSTREAKINDIHWNLLNLGKVYMRQDEFDIIHDHLCPLSLPIANFSRTPVVTTMHGPFNNENKKLFQTFMGPNVVTISHSQGKVISNINHAGVVHNGLPMEDYPFKEGIGEDFLLFVGRISMEKGVHLAIEAARMVDLPLVIAAKLDVVDIAYFRASIEPHLTDRVKWIGEVDQEERNRLMSRARAFLHLAPWREPFGLTLIEAMASGCPVVAFNHGSIPEIIKSGETGFVVEDLEEAVAAIDAIYSIDRAACRRHAITEFSAKRMADGYEAIYKKLVASRR
jgi:glycosyltransferase involved in cell wall biosynthesis